MIFIALDPNRRQSEYFSRAAGTARFAWNSALAMWNEEYRANGKADPGELRRRFNSTRREEFPWMGEVSNCVYAYPWIQLQKAFSAFFRKKARHPKFRSKRRGPESFYVCHREMEFDGRTLRLGPRKFKLGPIRMREELRFRGKVMGATIRRDAGRWLISVQVDVGDHRKDRVADGEIGVDLGITTLATLSTGEKIEGPKPLRKALGRLRRRSRQHSRKRKGSNNREKSRLRLARLHRRVRNIRKDALHRLTTRLCRENQAVAVEDLSVRGMIRAPGQAHRRHGLARVQEAARIQESDLRDPTRAGGQVLPVQQEVQRLRGGARRASARRARVPLPGVRPWAGSGPERGEEPVGSFGSTRERRGTWSGPGPNQNACGEEGPGCGFRSETTPRRSRNLQCVL